MRVLMLSTDALILEPGSESYGRMADYGTLADALDIIVCTTGAWKQELQISSTARAIPTSSSSKFWYVRDVLRAAKRKVLGDVDLVTSQDPFETGLAGWLLSHRLRAKLQLQVHTDFLSPYFARQSLKNRIRVWIAKWLLPKAHSIRVVSERIKKSLISLGLPSGKIAVLPIFVSTTANRSSSVDPRKKYTQFETVLLMVSRLEPEKNIGLALRAFADVVRAHPKAGLVVVGRGSEEKHLKQLVTLYHLEDSVVFEGFVQDTAPYFAGTDMFVNTSNYEGYGRTLVEAARAGLPIVTTDVGLVGEVINQENSMVVPVGAQQALGKALRRMVSDDALRGQLGDSARSAVAQLPNKEAMLERQKQLWQM